MGKRTPADNVKSVVPSSGLPHPISKTVVFAYPPTNVVGAKMAAKAKAGPNTSLEPPIVYAKAGEPSEVLRLNPGNGESVTIERLTVRGLYSLDNLRTLMFSIVLDNGTVLLPETPAGALGMPLNIEVPSGSSARVFAKTLDPPNWICAYPLDLQLDARRYPLDDHEPTSEDKNENAFKRHGNTWEVSLGQDCITVVHLGGLDDIAQIIVSGESGVSARDLQPVDGDLGDQMGPREVASAQARLEMIENPDTLATVESHERDELLDEAERLRRMLKSAHLPRKPGSPAVRRRLSDPDKKGLS